MTTWIAENWTLFELLALGGALAFCALFPGRRRAFARVIRRALTPVASRPVVAIGIAGLAPVVLRLLLVAAGAQAIPEPIVPDEFSYLLGAETFASGKLSNPPHPFWEHLEVPFVVHQPTYASMYPPGQALCLALGHALFGHPWFGVLIGVGFFGAALAWMLRGWMPATWAFVGALLFGLRLAGFGYWSGSYWGGALAAGAGALVLGAWPRLTRRRGARSPLRIGDALALGSGVALLANTRPFEGVVLCLPIAIALVLLLPRLGRSERLRLILPAALVLLVAGLAMGAYFQAVTGDALRMPYALHGATYGVQPNFVWQAPRPDIEHENPLLAGVFGIWAERFRDTRTALGWAAATHAKLGYIGAFFVGPLFGVGLLGLPWLLCSARGRLLLALLLWFLAGLSLEVSFFPHYAAPASALFALVVLQSLRHLRAAGSADATPAWRWLSVLAGAPLSALVLVVAGRTLVAASDLPVRFWAHPFDPWSQRATPVHARHLAARPLLDAGGKHLVFLRYTADQHHRKWAYNGADLANTPILWAWERGGAEDQRLIEALPERQVWLAWPDLTPPRIEPWPGK